MSPLSRAACLVAAIDQLLEEFEAFRLNPAPWVSQADAVTARWEEVARCSRLAELGEPPPLTEAGLIPYSPHRTESVSRNREADLLWENKLRALQQRARKADAVAPEANPPTPAEQADAGTDRQPRPPKQKRSTAKGEARTKIIAALSAHHQYSSGSCLNLEPIGNNELVRGLFVAKSTASDFFKKEFDGYDKYRALCKDASALAAALRLLNGEFSPRHLYGSSPPGEGHLDDE